MKQVKKLVWDKNDGPRPWREKRPVLCFYEYVGRVGNSTVTVSDTVMIKVEFDDQIEETFEKEMKQRFARWTPSRIGPRPLEWTLLKWLKQDGTTGFPPPEPVKLADSF